MQNLESKINELESNISYLNREIEKLKITVEYLTKMVHLENGSSSSTNVSSDLSNEKKKNAAISATIINSVNDNSNVPDKFKNDKNKEKISSSSIGFSAFSVEDFKNKK